MSLHDASGLIQLLQTFGNEGLSQYTKDLQLETLLILMNASLEIDRDYISKLFLKNIETNLEIINSIIVEKFSSSYKLEFHMRPDYKIDRFSFKI